MDVPLKEIERLYNLRNLRTVKKIDTGYTSTNYILDGDQGSFFFKQYDKKYDTARVRMITRGTEFIQSSQVPAISPISNRNSDKYFKHNSRIYSLFPFIDGVVHEFNTLTPDLLYKIGSMHGNILSRGITVGQERENYRKASNNLEDVRTRFKDEDNEVQKKLRTTNRRFNEKAINIQEIKKLFEETEDSNIQIKLNDRSLVHGDYWHRNIIFNENKIVGVVDFDKVKIDSRAKMVLRALDVICFNQNYNDSQYDQAKDYLSGLSETYEMKEHEFDHAIAFWRVNTMLNNQIVYHLIVRENAKFEDLLDVNLERITAWGENYEKHKEKLLKIHSIVYQ